MSPIRTFRDPVHVTIGFDPTIGPESLALRLIDTPPVQRLKHIRQLGLANLVYHGAEHSRFSHTLGVTHLANRMYRSAIGNPTQTPPDTLEHATVLAAAVLHDVGHMPFSHAMEKVLEVNHETFSLAIVKDPGPVFDALNQYGGPDFVDAVASHIANASDARTVGIISGQLDADRMDYVLRDGYHAGVPNARFDAERILQKVRLDTDGLLFDASAQQAIEGYLIGRYHLYLQLYLHPTVRAAEAMMRTIIRRAKDLAVQGKDLGDVGASVKALFSTTADAATVLRLTDHEMWAAFGVWANAPGTDSILQGLSKGLVNRLLYKVYDAPASTPADQLKAMVSKAKEVAENAGLDPDYSVILDTAKDAPFKFADAAKRVSPFRLRDANGTIRKLEDDNAIVKALEQSAYEMNRIVFPESLRKNILREINSIKP